MEHYLIAHDLGTSGDKATLFSTSGELIKSLTAVYDTHFFNTTWAEQDPEDWWNAFSNNNHQLLEGIDVSKVKAVAFSGQMMGCVVVDRQGRPLRPAIIWADLRSQDQEQYIKQHLDPWEFYQITGHRISASYSIEKLMWIRDNEPETYFSTYKMLQAKDYIISRLTGRFVTDYSDASSTNCLDLKALGWSDTILEAIGIDRNKLPEVHESTYVAGEISAKMSAACGLPAGTAVVIGGGDGVCAAVGSGSVSAGQTFTYLGSSSWVALTSDQPIFDTKMRTYNWAHLVPGKYSPNGTMQAAGNSYQFLRRTLCRDLDRLAEEQGVSPYQLMNDEISRSPLGAKGLLYLPYILGERSPRWNSEARGAFIGLKMEHTRGDMIRAGVEGILMNLAIILDVFRKNVEITDINVIGGLSKGDPIRHALADIFGVRAHQLSWLDEATSMGAAVTAGIGIGELKDFSGIDRFVHVANIVEPDWENHERYKAIREVFDLSYNALLETYSRLAKL